jgi:hypothetical protein
MSTRVAITDANIFIDLLSLDISEEFFQLPLSICTTIEVMLELDPDQQSVLQQFVSSGALFIEHEASIDDSLQFNSGFSPADRTLLSWAVSQNHLLLSGERMMRSWCKDRRIDYHGILWVFDQLLERNLIDNIRAIILLELLITKNQRLPIKECQIRIKQWSQDI